jgi:hypothetical protein
MTMKGRASLFMSDERRVDLWIALIDKWIACANERHVRAITVALQATDTEPVSN